MNVYIEFGPGAVMTIMMLGTAAFATAVIVVGMALGKEEKHDPPKK